MRILITQPWLAMLPIVTFGVLFRLRHQRLLWIPLLSWLLYFLWELGSYVSCDYSEGECNIRIDLVLIYPFLLAVTIFGVIAFVIEAVSKRRPA